MNTDKAMANFTSGKREWEFGVDVSVSVAKIGAGGDIDTNNLKGQLFPSSLAKRG